MNKKRMTKRVSKTDIDCGGGRQKDISILISNTDNEHPFLDDHLEYGFGDFRFQIVIEDGEAEQDEAALRLISLLRGNALFY